MTSTRIVLGLAACVGLFFFDQPTAAQSTPFGAPGYTVTTWFAGLADNPTALAVDGNGKVYLATYGGQVLIVEDVDQDGIAETVTPFFDGSGVFNLPVTGLALHAGKVYISHRGSVSTVEDTDGDMIGDTVVNIITGLPFGLDHQANGVVFDENDKMYIAQGSTTDHGPESDPFAATILQANDDGSNLQVWATGLRNVYGMDYIPGFGLVAPDNGPNTYIPNLNPADEINFIQQGLDYGYPNVFGTPPTGDPSEAPVVLLPAHSAPCAPAFDKNHAWNGFDYELYVPLVAAGAGSVVRVTLFKHPVTGEVEGWFHGIAGGFQNAIAVDFSPSGDLFVADFGTKTIQRILPEDSARIRVTGQPRLGQLLDVDIEAPDWPGHFYWFMLANAQTPGYPLPNGEILWLDVNSPLFNYSVTPGNIMNIFPLPGTLDSAGHDHGWVFIPNFGPIEGFEVWMAFVSYDAALNVGAVSESVPFKILGP